jgi:hypothetical protein
MESPNIGEKMAASGNCGLLLVIDPSDARNCD